MQVESLICTGPTVPGAWPSLIFRPLSFWCVELGSPCAAGCSRNLTFSARAALSGYGSLLVQGTHQLRSAIAWLHPTGAHHRIFSLCLCSVRFFLGSEEHVFPACCTPSGHGSWIQHHLNQESVPPCLQSQGWKLSGWTDAPYCAKVLD